MPEPEGDDRATVVGVIMMVAAALVVLWLISTCVGCASQKAAEGGATQGAGFQSASGNKLETGDIGDKAGDDMEKDESSTTKQGVGVQIINDQWAIVILLCAMSLIREFFSWARMRLKS